MSIVDRDGNALSMTTTIESGFGSYQMVRGFLLNNQLTDFSLHADRRRRRARRQSGRAGQAAAQLDGADDRVRRQRAPGRGHRLARRQRRSSSTSPRRCVGVFDWNLDIQQAIDLGNFGAQTTATTKLEKGSSVKDLEPGLKARGHTVAVVDINTGLHGIVTARQRRPPRRPRGDRAGRYAAGPAAPTRAAKARRPDIDCHGSFHGDNHAASHRQYRVDLRTRAG